MHVIGLVGGIASGKSLVAQMLADHGAEVIDADRIAHEVLKARDTRDAIVEHWGAEALGADGEINRAWLAARVFGPDERAAVERRQLEAIVHPAIGRAMDEEMSRLRNAKTQAVVIDAPLLMEGGLDEHCDTLVFVAAPAAARATRAASRGWSDEEWQRREATQLDLEEKRRQADVVLENDRDLDALRAEVARLYNERLGNLGERPGE